MFTKGKERAYFVKKKSVEFLYLTVNLATLEVVT